MKPSIAIAVEPPPPAPSWWQRLGARIFGLPLYPPPPPVPLPRLRLRLVNDRYPPAEVFAVRDYYTGRFYCIRPPDSFAFGCGPVLVTMATTRVARAALFNTREDAQAFVDEHMRRADEIDEGYRREPFYGEIVRLAEVEEPT